MLGLHSLVVLLYVLIYIATTACGRAQSSHNRVFLRLFRKDERFELYACAYVLRLELASAYGY